jgi:hypothetical protein
LTNPVKRFVGNIENLCVLFGSSDPERLSAGDQKLLVPTTVLFQSSLDARNQIGRLFFLGPTLVLIPVCRVILASLAGLLCITLVRGQFVFVGFACHKDLDNRLAAANASNQASELGVATLRFLFLPRIRDKIREVAVSAPADGPQSATLCDKPTGRPRARQALLSNDCVHLGDVAIPFRFGEALKPPGFHERCHLRIAFQPIEILLNSLSHMAKHNNGERTKFLANLS